MVFFRCGLSRKESRLDVLINNAGVARGVRSKLDQITPAGLNLEFAVNVLGPFYLTQLLLPILTSTAASSSDGKARVVNLSSGAHMFSKTGKNGPIDYRTLEGRQIFPFFPYAQSKSVSFRAFFLNFPVVDKLQRFILGTTTGKSFVLERARPPIWGPRHRFHCHSSRYNVLLVSLYLH
jgi:short-subunit dehydrogenase involved in D-alanine esterification of teichoic acids